MSFTPPQFIAFTGVDRLELLPGLERLARRYPIEWGVLIDEQPRGTMLFPAADTVRGLLATRGLRWAAHVCGTLAQRIAAGTQDAPVAVLEGFGRLQINHAFSGSDALQVSHCAEYSQRCGVRAVLQCQGEFPADTRVDWLYDVSFGRGSRPSSWPRPAPAGTLCGFSGGLNASNVRDVLTTIAAPAGSSYWIDMESGVRTDGMFDLDQCAAVCRAVFD